MSRYEGEFDELEKLGKGGFGEVFMVQNKFDLQKYAIKRIELSGVESQQAEKIVMREVESLAALQHTNVVRYHTTWMECMEIRSQVNMNENSQSSEYFSSQEFGDNSMDVELNFKASRNPSNGETECSLSPFLFIQMQLCDSSLDKWLKTRNKKIAISFLSPNDVNCLLDIYKQLLNALAYIHSENILHRDLKPGNILLNGEIPQVLLGDFGLSRLISSKNSSIETTCGDIPVEVVSSKRSAENLDKYTPGCGTLLYAAPEQLNTSNYDFKADMYSAGVTLYEMTSIFGESQHERIKSLENLRKTNFELSKSYVNHYKKIAPVIESLVSQDPKTRPSADELLKNPLFLQKNDLQVQTSNKINQLEKKNAAYRKKLFELGVNPDDIN